MHCDGGVRPRRYAVIGTGAIGGLYGARLAASGQAVTFLGRSDVEVLRREGLHVHSVDGDITLDDVAVETDPARVGPVDVVLVAIKATGNAALATLLPPLVQPGTVVVLAQNGFGVEAAIAEMVPEATVLGALCFVCATRTAPGHIDHIDYGGVTLAEHTDDGHPAGVTTAVRTVAADFEHAGIEVSTSRDLLAARWRKLVWNMPFNGLSVVLDAGTDELVGDPALCRACRALMDEIVAVATAHGHGVGDGFAERMIENTRTMKPYATSMKLDFAAGRPLELAGMYDAPLAMAAELGVSTPGLSLLAAQLHHLDAVGRHQRQ